MFVVAFVEIVFLRLCPVFLKDFVEEKTYGIARNGNGTNNFSMDKIMSEAIVKMGSVVIYGLSETQWD